MFKTVEKLKKKTKMLCRFDRSQSFRQGPLQASSRSLSHNSCNVNSSISAHPLLPIETGLYIFISSFFFFFLYILFHFLCFFLLFPNFHFLSFFSFSLYVFSGYCLIYGLVAKNKTMWTKTTIADWLCVWVIINIRFVVCIFFHVSE